MTFNKYDPHDEAAIGQEASTIVASLKTNDQPHDPTPGTPPSTKPPESWSRAMETRQRNGMYYRPLTGRTDHTSER